MEAVFLKTGDNDSRVITHQNKVVLKSTHRLYALLEVTEWKLEHSLARPLTLTLLRPAGRGINGQLTANAEAEGGENRRLTDWISTQCINDSLLFRSPSIFDA
ncbi:uncharacterized [Tachysurus ichikawai]